MIKYHPLEEIIPLYLNNIELKNSTKREYQICFNQYIHFLKCFNVFYAQSSNLIQYKRELIEKMYKASTIKKHLTLIKNLYSWLKENYKVYHLNEIYSSDISKYVKNVYVSKEHRKQAFTKSEVKKILEFLNNSGDSLTGKRIQAIFLLMITTGVRGIEVCRAKRSDIVTHGHESILYIHGKGRFEADQFVKLSRDVVIAINNYLFMRKDELPYLFVTHDITHPHKMLTTHLISTQFKKILKTIHIDTTNKSLHSLRHTAAHFNILRGGSIYQTQKLLRHTHLETTLIYLHHLERIHDDSEDKILEYILKERKHYEK
jgi:integrase